MFERGFGSLDRVSSIAERERGSGRGREEDVIEKTREIG